MGSLLAFFQFLCNIEVLVDDGNKHLHHDNYSIISLVRLTGYVDLQFANNSQVDIKIAIMTAWLNGISASTVS